MNLRYALALLIAGGCGAASTGGGGKPETLSLTVAVSTTGLATGAIIATSGGVSLVTCPNTTCTTQATLSSTVTLSASAGTASMFIGWSGDCAGSDSTCTLSMAQPMSATAHFRRNANYVFITTTTLAVPFGATAAASLAAADNFCNARAAAAGLPGHYVAWLSTSTANAVDRLGNANGWVRTDGQPFANLRSDLVAGKVFYPPVLGEDGSNLDLSVAATGTDGDGTVLPAQTCVDWTQPGGAQAGTGAPGFGSHAWTAEFFNQPCSGPFSLYCFETSLDAVAAPASAAGRIAFVSKATLAPGPGKSRADADAICQAEAQAAGLPPPYTNYLSLLAVNGQAPLGRFTVLSHSLPWMRPDGVAIVAQASDLGVSKPLLAPIDVAADGTYLPGGSTWTGSVGAPSIAAGSTSTCNDWASNAGSGNGGRFEDTINWSDEYRNSLICAEALPVYCLQN
jgi:hypothetical protein